MPRTGARAAALRALLHGVGAALDEGLLLPSVREVAQAGFERDVWRVYTSLGGVRAEARIAPGGWDLVVDGLAVELDEDLHFNRYRRLTLDSPMYELLRAYPARMSRSSWNFATAVPV